MKRAILPTAVLPYPPETDYTNQGKIVSLPHFFNGFDQVPDEGASYSVQLCTDVPVNHDPTALVGLFGRANLGHSFLVLTKHSRNLIVSQCFGFYPVHRPSMWHPTKPVTAVIKDNGCHEINAMIMLMLTEGQFSSVKKMALMLAASEYKLLDFNCTDYALNVFNSVQDDPIQLDPFPLTLPGLRKSSKVVAIFGVTSIGSTPQMLFAALNRLKQRGGPMADRVVIDLSVSRLAPASFGEC